MRLKPRRRGDNPKYAWDIRSNSHSGSKRQAGNDLVPAKVTIARLPKGARSE
jgi:hypothetical protein